MIALSIDLSHIHAFLLLLCRVGGLLIAAPLIGSDRLPARLRAGLALAISFALFPTAAIPPETNGAVALALAAGGEVLLGFGLGFGASLIFAAVQMAGEIADVQSAFGFAGMVSPQTGERNSVIGQLQLSLTWLIFLAANGHHAILRALGASLAALPLGSGPGLSAPLLTQAVGALLGASVRIAAPILGAVILTDFALGLLTRAAPQMNLLAVGFPIKLAVGLGAALLSLPLLVGAERGLISTMESLLHGLLLAAG